LNAGEFQNWRFLPPVLTRNTCSPIGVIINFIYLAEIDKLLSAYFKTSFTGKNPGKGERCAELIMASHRYSKNEIEKR